MVLLFDEAPFLWETNYSKATVKRQNNIRRNCSSSFYFYYIIDDKQTFILRQTYMKTMYL